MAVGARIFLLFFVSISLMVPNAHAQTRESKKDSLYKKFKRDSAWIFRPREIFPLIAIDQRNSFLRTSKNTNSPVNIWGIKVGITLFNRHNLGIGAYSLQSNTKRQRMSDNSTIDRNLSFQYLTVFYEYSFIETKWWEVGIPVEIGYGQYNVKSYIENKEQYLTNRSGNVIPLGAALDIYFKPTAWFGVNVMGGYRYVVNNQSKINLSGWFYSVGVAVYVRQIIQDTRYYFTKRTYKKESKKMDL